MQVMESALWGKAGARGPDSIDLSKHSYIGALPAHNLMYLCLCINQGYLVDFIGLH